MMEIKRPGTETKGHFRPRLPTPAKAFARSKHRRPTISGPIGPIKNSRGPDFTRSDTLIIVPGIKDCGSDESLPEKQSIAAKKATRRISAGFSTRGPLVSSPTVARSDFNVTTTCSAPVATKRSRQFRKISSSSLASSPKTILTSSSTVDFLPRLDSISQDENAPPSMSECSPPLASISATTPLVKSQLPKSRTMGVLHELKTSISRPSLMSRSANSRNFGGSTRQTSGSSTTTTTIPASNSRLRLPRPSLTSLSRASRSSSPDPQPESKAQPHHITAAQHSAYWSGRFVALHDRFASEGLHSDSTQSLSSPNQTPPGRSSTPDRFPPRSSSFRPTHLSHSITTSALNSKPFPSQRKPPPSDEETSCRRIFNHLEALCTTAEARRSLHDFQQAYARRYGRSGLLPQGGCMEDKSLMNRLFGGGGRKGERRSLSVLREISNQKASKRAGNMVGGRGKRLSIY